METQGIVESIRHDKKGLKLNNQEWYSSFLHEVKCNRGDEVKVTYTENTKDGRTFKNFDKIEVLNATKIPSSNQQEERLNSVLTSYAKDLAVAKIGQGASDLGIVMLEARDVILETYNKIKEELNEKPKTTEPKEETTRETLETVKPEDLY